MFFRCDHPQTVDFSYRFEYQGKSLGFFETCLVLRYRVVESTIFKPQLFKNNAMISVFQTWGYCLEKNKVANQVFFSRWIIFDGVMEIDLQLRLKSNPLLNQMNLKCPDGIISVFPIFFARIFGVWYIKFFFWKYCNLLSELCSHAVNIFSPPRC